MTTIQRYALIVGGVILLLVGLATVSYYKGRSDMRTEIMDAPTKIDSVWVHDTLYSMPQTLQGKPIPVPFIPDSVKSFVASLKIENDSLRAIVDTLLSPIETSVNDSTVAESYESMYSGQSLTIHYNLYTIAKPFERTIQSVLTLLPIPLDKLTVTKISYVEKERPWYEVPAYLLIGGTAGYLISQATK
jgi:hypothetical protein